MIHVEHLEANIVNYCDNHCVNCSHFANVYANWTMTPEQLYTDCHDLSAKVHCRDFFLIGGEPLLHPDFLAMAAAAEASGLADRIGILTNGNRLDAMPERYFDALNIIIVSVYGDRAAPAQRVHDLCRARDIELQIHRRYNFHRMLTPAERTEAEAVQTFTDCNYGKSCFIVEYGYLYTCASAPVMPGKLLGLDPHIDGMHIATSTEAQLDAYLAHEDRKFLHACKRCEYQFETPWRELQPGEDWFEESAK